MAPSRELPAQQVQQPLLRAILRAGISLLLLLTLPLRTTSQDLAYLINERDQERRRGGTASEQMGKIRGSFNTLERLLTGLEKTQREVEEAPARFKL